MEDIYSVVEATYRTLGNTIESIIQTSDDSTNDRLSALERCVLVDLLNKDNQRPSELARRVNRPPTSFTPTLDGLQYKGLIVRKADPSDRRAIRIALTEKGEARRARTAYEQRRFQQFLKDRLSKEEITQLNSLLNRLLMA